MKASTQGPHTDTPCSASMTALLAKVRACTQCQAHLPLAPKPILQASSQARILIAGQAPWHHQLLALMTQIELILILGQYAIDYHLPREPLTVSATALGILSGTTQTSSTLKPKSITVTQATEQWQQFWPKFIVLPHPSPRNNRWLKQHPEFENNHLPRLRARVLSLLQQQD